MTNEEILISLTKHKEEIGSLKHRVDDIEELCKSINELAISVKELAINVSNTCNRMDNFDARLKNQGTRIGELEKKPAKKWDSIESVIITSIVGAIVGFFISKVF